MHLKMLKGTPYVQPGVSHLYGAKVTKALRGHPGRVPTACTLDLTMHTMIYAEGTPPGNTILDTFCRLLHNVATWYSNTSECRNRRMYAT